MGAESIVANVHWYCVVRMVATQETKPLLFRPRTNVNALQLLAITTDQLFPLLIRVSCTGPGLEGQIFAVF